MKLRRMAFAMIVAAAAIPAGVAAQHEHESSEGATAGPGAEAGMMDGTMMCHRVGGSMMGGEGGGSMMGGEGGGSMMGGEGGGSMMGGESGGSMMGGEGGGSMMGGEGRGSMMGGEGMVAIMGTKLSTILRQKDALGLTETQIQDVEAVQQRLGQRHETHKEDMKAMAARRAEILGEDQPDLEDLESILSKEADERVEMHMYMARSGREALQLLSEEQRSNLQYARRLSHNGMKGSGSTRHH